MFRQPALLYNVSFQLCTHKRNYAHLFPNSRLASEAFICVFLWFRSRYFDDLSVQLAPVHVVDGVVRIRCSFKLDVSKASMLLFRAWQVRFGQVNFDNVAKWQEGVVDGLLGHCRIETPDKDSGF
jgi:hypothetical protein